MQLQARRALERAIEQHQAQLRACHACPDMIGPVVVGQPVVSPVMLIGQAPGAKEGPAGRPFAWTAGKTLFKWFSSIGLDEEAFRNRAYMAAVCRCFPGKHPKGGDRVPSQAEIDRCGEWLQAEFELLRPQLLIPVGKLAIAQFMSVGKLTEVIGQVHPVDVAGQAADLIPLPHPSGASTWHRTEPGMSHLKKALQLIDRHPAWREIRDAD
jgi:uracil-DNA glycosylase